MPDFLPPQYWQFGSPFRHRHRNLRFDDLMTSDDADHGVTLVVVGHPLCLIFALDIILLRYLDWSYHFTHSLFLNMATKVGNCCQGFQSWSILKISRGRLSRISSRGQSQNSEEEKKDEMAPRAPSVLHSWRKEGFCTQWSYTPAHRVARDIDEHFNDD